jgi:hypothetical protein
MNKSDVQIVITDIGAESAEQFMDTFENVSHNKILLMLIMMFGNHESLPEFANDIENAVAWLKVNGVEGV